MSVTQLVGRVAAKDAVDEILSGRHGGQAATLRRAVAALDPGVLHQHRHRAVSDPDAAAKHQPGVHPLRALEVLTE
jgi:hypothetical protein